MVTRTSDKYINYIEGGNKFGANKKFGKGENIGTTKNDTTLCHNSSREELWHKVVPFSVVLAQLLEKCGSLPCQNVSTFICFLYIYVLEWSGKAVR